MTADWKDIETAPSGTWVLLGYQQQGDEMPNGLFVGIGMVFPHGKIWIMNAFDNEKALPSKWDHLPSAPERIAP